MPCICGNDGTTESCCGPLIAGQREAVTAEQLMRSRYAAYALESMDYLFSTQDPATLDAVDRPAAERWAKRARWQGLEVMAVEQGTAEDERGVVEFKARYTIDGESMTHHERSRFRRLDGRWVYVDGQAPRGEPLKRATAKVGRNDKCPCGSGNKYKRCCGA